MNVFDTLFPPRSRSPGRNRPRRPGTTARRSGNRLRSFGMPERLERRDLLAISASGIERTTPAQFFIDTGTGLNAAYTAYSITNAAPGPLVDVWVKATNFSAGTVGLAEDGIYHLGELGGGETGTAFLYFAASGPSSTAQSYDIEIWDHDPAMGGSPTVTKQFTFTDVLETIKADPNKITGVSFTPANPSVGDTLTMTVTGELGNGADRVLFAPATKTTWQADVFELRGTKVKISGTDVNVPPNRLFFDTTDLPPATNKQPFTIDYEFLIARPSSTTTQTSPTQYTQDGQQDWKHHDPASAPLPIIPALKYKLDINKTDFKDTYTPGEITTYTITLVNSGNIPINNVLVEDTLPFQIDPTSTWTASYSANSSPGTLGLGGIGSFSGTVNLGKLDGTVTITIFAKVFSSATGQLINTIYATAPDDTPISSTDVNDK